MKFLIAGAGAIGAYVGARLAQAGFDVTLFARGPHLRAMQEHGVRVRSVEGDFQTQPRIVGSLDQAGQADVVFLGVKLQRNSYLVKIAQARCGFSRFLRSP